MSEKPKSIIPYFLCLLVCTIFGFSFLFSKMALEVASTMTLISVRFLIAFAIMNLLLLTRRVKLSLKGKPVFKLLLLGLVQPVIYFLCETQGIALTSSSFAGVMLGLLPVSGCIFGRIFLKEKISPVRVVCVILSVCGVILTTVGGEVKISFMGLCFLIGAVVSATLFSVLSRSISEIFTAYERTYVMFLLGSVVFTIMALIQLRGNFASLLVPFTSAKFWVAVLYLAGLSSVCAFMLLNYALNYVNVGTQTLFSNFGTVISVLAGIFIMHEQFSLWQILGIVIIIISVIIVSITGKALSAKRH